MGILCGVQLEWGRQEVRYLERERQGRGNEFPLPVGPSPRGDITTVQHMGRSRRRAGHGCSPDIATHGPCPREGAGEERRRRGRGGGCRQKCTGIRRRRRRRGAGEKQDGWSVRDRGGGTRSPSPSAPPPVAISPRSSARGDPGKEPGTAAPLISPRTDPAPGRGRGRSAEGAGGAGAAGRSVWVLPRKSRRSKGASELHRYPPAKARAGCGLLARYPGILLRRHGWGGAAGKERMDIPSRTRRRRRQYSSLGTGPNVFWNSWQHYRV